MDVIVQPDGKIVAAGHIESADYNYADFAIARFNADGSADASFGSDSTGIVLTDFYGQPDYAWGALALQPDV